MSRASTSKLRQTLHNETSWATKLHIDEEVALSVEGRVCEVMGQLIYRQTEVWLIFSLTLMHDTELLSMVTL